MSSTTKTTVLAAMVIVAALAGVMLADESEGATEVTAVSYTDGSYTTSSVLDSGAASIEIKGVEDFTQMESDGFLYWVSASGTPYYAGATIAVAAISESDVIDGVFVLTATYKATDVTVSIDGAASAAETIEIDGETYYIVPEDVTAPAGTIFAGWSVETETIHYTESEGTYTIADAETEGALSVTVFVGVEVGDIVIATFEDVYTVTFVVDGTTVYTATSDSFTAPQAPSKDHYEFVGWAVDGEIVDVASYAITEDTIFTAVFTAEILTVTFVAGDYETTVLVAYGECIVMPSLPEGYSAWDFDFSQAVTESMTVYAIETVTEETGVYQVQFVVDGVVVATYNSDAITLPTSPSKDGYSFVGWAIGTDVITDPVSYVYTQDTVLTALFEAVSVVEWTVTFIDGTDVVATVTVADGSTVEGAPDAPEGKFWNYDSSAAIHADTVVYAEPEYVTVTFWIGNSQIGILTQTVAYGDVVDASGVQEYNLPEGYSGWDWDFGTPVYADTAIHALETVYVEEPGFLDSTMNVLLVIVIVIVIIVMFAIIMILRAQNRLPACLSVLAKKSDDGDDVIITTTKTATVKAAAAKTETEDETATVLKKE